MTIDEIFSHLSAHMIKGLMIHDEIAAAYGFLNLCGYQKCHDYHYFEENNNYKCLQTYYLNHYHKLIPKEKVEEPEIIPPNWYKYTRQEVDANTKRSAVKDLMKKWVTWEKETKELLEKSYKEVVELGDVCAAIKIKSMLEDNVKELMAAERKQIDLDMIGYDISVIIGEQSPLYDKYLNKMRYVFEGDYQ